MRLECHRVDNARIFCFQSWYRRACHQNCHLESSVVSCRKTNSWTQAKLRIPATFFRSFSEKQMPLEETYRMEQKQQLSAVESGRPEARAFWSRNSIKPPIIHVRDAGIVNIGRNAKSPESCLENMISAVRHRGPDGFGFYKDNGIGLAHADWHHRSWGRQPPMAHEDKTCWIASMRDIQLHRAERYTRKNAASFLHHVDTEWFLHLYEITVLNCLNSWNAVRICILEQKG